MAKKTVEEQVDMRVSKDDVALMLFDTAIEQWKKGYVEHMELLPERIKAIETYLTNEVKAAHPALFHKDSLVGLTPYGTKDACCSGALRFYRNEFAMFIKAVEGDNRCRQPFAEKIETVTRVTVRVDSNYTEGGIKFESRLNFKFNPAKTAELKAIISAINESADVLNTPPPALKKIRKTLAIASIRNTDGGEAFLVKLAMLVEKPLALPAPK